MRVHFSRHATTPREELAFIVSGTVWTSLTDKDRSNNGVQFHRVGGKGSELRKSRPSETDFEPPS